MGEVRNAFKFGRKISSEEGKVISLRRAVISEQMLRDLEWRWGLMIVSNGGLFWIWWWTSKIREFL